MGWLKQYKEALSKDEAKRLISIMPDDTLKTLCRLHYLERRSLDETAYKMHYSKRQVERLNRAAIDYALRVLLKTPEADTISLITIKALVEDMLSGENTTN